MSKMKISENGINLIKKFESLRLHAYLDLGDSGIATIGYGTTFIDGRPVVMGMVITELQANEYLMKDILKFENSVNKLISVEISQKMFDALVSFVYNVGTSNFEKSTLLKCINKGQFDLASAEFEKWNKSQGKILKGLIRRRTEEAKLFSEGISEIKNIEEVSLDFEEIEKLSKNEKE
jgi:lysozyme